MAYLSISLLGPFHAWKANGVLQPFRTLKERALLAYLVVENGQMHRRETLAELFWPGRPEGIARNNLRQALYGIRQGIGEAGFDAIFTITADEVQANLSEQIWLDLAAFEIHAKAAQQHQHPAGGTCPYCLQHLREAVEIYRGSFLEDIYLDKNQEYQDWAVFRREQYMRLLIQSLEALTGEYERMGDYAQAALYAGRQVQLDDLKESLYQRLMVLLARTGRINAALEAYEACRRKFREVLNSELDEKTVALAEQIRAGEIDPGPASGQAVMHNLPEQLTPFIGREMELTHLTGALENPSCRLISLVGLGGVGKTRLAIQTARLNLPLFPDGLYFISLDTALSVDQLNEAIGRGVGLVPGADQSMGQVLIEYLHPRHILLVLDDFQHSTEGKERLLEILREAPYVKILLTTRERLRLQAGCMVGLEGLPSPKGGGREVDLQNAQAQVFGSDAMRLLLERASRVRPGWPAVERFVPGPRNGGSRLPIADDPREVEAALRICRMVEGLPLGIELAASWAHDYTFSQIAEEVQRNLEFLQTSLQDLPERHRSLRASFEHSWDLLAESEREVFSRLAVFPGSFSAKAALEVSGAAQPWLIRLGDKSLVRRAAPGRYQLHPLLRQFAGQKLRQYSRKIEDQTHQQHAQFFCNFLKDRELDLKGFRQADALSEVETELENIYTGWNWAVEHHAFDLIELASFGLLFFLESRSRWREGETLFRCAIDSLQQNSVGNGSSQRVLATLSAGLGWFCCRLSRFQESGELLQRSLRILEEQDLHFVRIFAHFALGFQSTWMSRFDEAWLHLSTCLSLSEQVGDRWGLAWSRQILAEIAFESGKTGFNEKPFLETLALFEPAGELRGSSRALNYLGNIALAQERYADAQAYFEKLLANMEKVGDVWGQAGGYSKLGQLASARGAYEQAWSFQQRSLGMLQKMGDQRRTAYTMGQLGEVAAALSKPLEAAAYFRQALEIAVEAHSTPLAQNILTGVASAMFRRAQKEAAVDLLALVIAEPIGDKLTASRAARLWESMQAARGSAQPTPRTLWQAVDDLLRDGVRL
jgi:DNA-binding SARP family transcriptional activator/predicted ATPase